MTQAEIEKKAQEYASKIYGVDAIPISWRQEDGFEILAKAREQIADAFIAGAEYARTKCAEDGDINVGLHRWGRVGGLLYAALDKTQKDGARKMIRKLLCRIGWHKWEFRQVRCYCNDHLIDSLRYFHGVTTICCNTNGMHWRAFCKFCNKRMKLND